METNQMKEELEDSDKTKIRNMEALVLFMKRNPEATGADIRIFLKSVSDRVEINKASDLESIIEEENRIVILSQQIAKDIGVDETKFKIHLHPNPNHDCLIFANRIPPEIWIGCRITKPGFHNLLADAIKSASRLYKSNTFETIDKVFEWNDEHKRFKVVKDSKGAIIEGNEPEHYFSLISESRLKLEHFQLVIAVDRETGELINLSKKVDMFFDNGNIDLEARLLLSRQLMKKGLLDSIPHEGDIDKLEENINKEIGITNENV
jgi:hypothetical protein